MPDRLPGEEHLLTAGQLATITGKSKSTTAKWRVGAREMLLLDLAKVFRFLETNQQRIDFVKIMAERRVRWLKRGEEAPPPAPHATSTPPTD